MVANFFAGFLLSIGSVNASLGLVFGCFSVLFWILLREHGNHKVLESTTGLSTQALVTKENTSEWSAMGTFDFLNVPPQQENFNTEVLTDQFYRYRIQYIAWPPTIREACSLGDLELFLRHLQLGRNERVLVLTQLDTKATIAEVLRLSTAFGVTLISDIESKMKRESLPDSAAFHRILIFGPAEKRVRWEIALHGLLEKNRPPQNKLAQEIQL